jgi:hypothetical protein
MTLLLNPRLWIALALAGVLAFSHFTVYRSGRAAVQAKWDAAAVAQERASQAQTARNLELQRAAERKYVVQQDARDRFHTVTVRELRHETDNLSACVLTPDAVRVLNDARACALSDTSAACGADDPLPKP